VKSKKIILKEEHNVSISSSGLYQVLLLLRKCLPRLPSGRFSHNFGVTTTSTPTLSHYIRVKEKRTSTNLFLSTKRFVKGGVE